MGSRGEPGRATSPTGQSGSSTDAALPGIPLAQAARLMAPRGSVLVEVPTRSVEYRKRWQEWPRYLKRWPLWLCPGRWDQGGRALPPFREEQMRELVEAGGAFHQTPTYQRMRDALQRRGRVDEPPLESIEALDDYFARQARLLESIRRDGLKTQRQLDGKPGHDLTVRIDRDGRMIKCREGTHRHAMALALELPAVPVTVDLVHWRWARRCLALHDPGRLEESLHRGLSEFGRILRWPWRTTPSAAGQSD